MNRRMVFYTIGQILIAEGVLLLLPAFVSVYYKEVFYKDFFLAAAIAAAAGALLCIKKPANRVIYAREGFAIVGLAWGIMSLIGAIPFYISGQIPSFIDALFETVSGFSTTGASILSNVEMLSKGMLFWRSFTHWIGGMGVLVFVMTIIPLAGDRSIYLVRAELTGPIVDKLVPRMRDSAKILYGIYIVLTLIEIILLKAGDMPLFDSVVNSFATVGTGGFSIKNTSITAYDNAYFDYVITIFMVLSGMNFNTFYLLLARNFKSILKNGELRVYLIIIITSVAIIAINIRGFYGNIGETLRYAAFQVTSIITTTGYVTADFDLWPELSKMILLMLMFFGSCAGSTGGGVKIVRIMLLVRTARREIMKLVHPRAVSTVKLGGKVVGDDVIRATCVFLIVYVAILLLSLILLSLNEFDFITNFSASAACLNTTGPGFGLVGPTSNYGIFPASSKVVLIFLMLFGRLEIFPLLLILAPSTWRKKI